MSLYDEVKLHKKTFYGIVGPSRGQHAEFFAKIRSPNQLPVMASNMFDISCLSCSEK